MNITEVNLESTRVEIANLLKHTNDRNNVFLGFIALLLCDISKSLRK